MAATRPSAWAWRRARSASPTVSLWQGLTLTEKAKDNLAKAADKMTGSVAGQSGSSVEHPGRVIAAMALDPAIMDRSGGDGDSVL